MKNEIDGEREGKAKPRIQIKSTEPGKLTRTQRRELNKRKARELAAGMGEKMIFIDMKRYIKPFTSVYENEIRIVPKRTPP